MEDEVLCDCCGKPMKCASEIAFEVQPGGLWTVTLTDFVEETEFTRKDLAPTELIAFLRKWGVDEDQIAIVQKDLDETTTHM